jgi:hypothetical protein
MTDSHVETTIDQSLNTIDAAAGNGWLIAGHVCGFFTAIVTTIIGVFVLPQFSDVFAHFGADVPLVTRLIIHDYLFIWVLPLAIFLARRFWPNSRRRNFVLGMIGIGSSVAAIPIMVIAMYLPVFGLEATM